MLCTHTGFTSEELTATIVGTKCPRCIDTILSDSDEISVDKDHNNQHVPYHIEDTGDLIQGNNKDHNNEHVPSHIEDTGDSNQDNNNERFEERALDQSEQSEQYAIGKTHNKFKTYETNPWSRYYHQQQPICESSKCIQSQHWFTDVEDTEVEDIDIRTKDTEVEDMPAGALSDGEDIDIRTKDTEMEDMPADARALADDEDIDIRNTEVEDIDIRTKDTEMEDMPADARALADDEDIDIRNTEVEDMPAGALSDGEDIDIRTKDTEMEDMPADARALADDEDIDIRNTEVEDMPAGALSDGEDIDIRTKDTEVEDMPAGALSDGEDIDIRTKDTEMEDMPADARALADDEDIDLRNEDTEADDKPKDEPKDEPKDIDLHNEDKLDAAFMLQEIECICNFYVLITSKILQTKSNTKVHRNRRYWQTVVAFCVQKIATCMHDINSKMNSNCSMDLYYRLHHYPIVFKVQQLYSKVPQNQPETFASRLHHLLSTCSVIDEPQTFAALKQYIDNHHREILRQASPVSPVSPVSPAEKEYARTRPLSEKTITFKDQTNVNRPNPFLNITLKEDSVIKSFSPDGDTRMKVSIEVRKRGAVKGKRIVKSLLTMIKPFPHLRVIDYNTMASSINVSKVAPRAYPQTSSDSTNIFGFASKRDVSLYKYFKFSTNELTKQCNGKVKLNYCPGTAFCTNYKVCEMALKPVARKHKNYINHNNKLDTQIQVCSLCKTVCETADCAHLWGWCEGDFYVLPSVNNDVADKLHDVNIMFFRIGEHAPYCTMAATCKAQETSICWFKRVFTNWYSLSGLTIRNARITNESGSALTISDVEPYFADGVDKINGFLAYLRKKEQKRVGVKTVEFRCFWQLNDAHLSSYIMYKEQTQDNAI
eukprot:77824_1